MVQSCTRCILTTEQAPQLKFDANGVCNFCTEYDIKVAASKELNEENFKKIAKKISQKFANKKYDCIAGLSGGVDSTYVLYKLKEYNLRPLVVHLDNGWDSELAVQNIENAVTKLGFDLYTHVINWDEFRDLQRSYFKANVVDIEALTDHAIAATLFHLANKFGLQHIISGENFRTEGRLPEHWVHFKNDLINIKAIHKRFGSIPIKTFPTLGYIKGNYYSKIKKIQTLPILDYIPYIKSEAKKEITEKLGWRDYGGKHYESVFTRFYQSYILPEKFKIDKRYSHYSTLICSGQVSRQEVLEWIKEPTYDAAKMQEDKTYVLKKLGFSEAEFENYLQQPEVLHDDYPSFINLMNRYKKIKKMFGVN